MNEKIGPKIIAAKNQLEQQLKEKYALKKDEPAVIFNKPKEMLECTLLIEQMEESGASHDELMQVLSYMVVVINADKNRLSWLRAYQDFKIDDLVEKYMYKEDTANE